MTNLAVIERELSEMHGQGILNNGFSRKTLAFTNMFPVGFLSMWTQNHFLRSQDPEAHSAEAGRSQEQATASTKPFAVSSYLVLPRLVLRSMWLPGLWSQCASSRDASQQPSCTLSHADLHPQPKYDGAEDAWPESCEAEAGQPRQVCQASSL